MSKEFMGKDKTYLDNYYGQKGAVLTFPSGEKAIVYTKTKNLKSTPINKGVTTLDPMVSPSMQKKERFIYFIDEAGKVVRCKYEMEYNR